MSNDRISRNARTVSRYFDIPLTQARRVVSGEASIQDMWNLYDNLRTDWTMSLVRSDSAVQVVGTLNVSVRDLEVSVMDDPSVPDNEIALSLSVTGGDDHVYDLITRHLGLELDTPEWILKFIELYGGLESQVQEIVKESGIEVLQPMAVSRGFEPSVD